MSEFLREIEEDIKEEQFVNLWRKYGNYVLGTAGVIVITAVAYPTWTHYHTAKSHTAQEKYAQALSHMEEGHADKAIPLLDELIQSHKGYGKLATLQKAALLTEESVKQSKTALMDEAQKLYGDLAAQNAKDPSLGKFALVTNAYRAIAMGDETSWRKDVEPLTAPNQPWRALALETLALSDMKQGRESEAAGRYVEILKDKRSSMTSISRALRMLAHLKVPTTQISEESAS